MLTNEQFDELAQPERGRVNARIYTDPEIFQEELKRIFYRGWVYVGHESEVAEPGDYKTAYMGLVPVILTRDENDDLHVLVNRCIHRGTTVCQREYGNSSFFRCEYHGWTYANTGDLIGVTLQRGFKNGELDEIQKHLDRAPRVATYRGLIFASFSPSGLPLDEYLGGARRYIDDWMDTSPTGEIAVEGGVWKHTYAGNWKIGLEGADERYHVTFLHHIGAVLAARRGQSGARYGPTDPSLQNCVDFGHGHGAIEINSDRNPAAWQQKYAPEYVEALMKRLGEERATQVLSRVNRMHIFPNVAFGPENIRVFRPIAPDRTEVYQYLVKFPAVPGVTERVNRQRIQIEQGGYGPAGYIGADDLEIFARMQEGYQALSFEGNNPWVWFNRDVNTQRRGPDGERLGEDMSEVAQSAIYRGWVELMKGSVPAGSVNAGGGASGPGA